MPILFNARSQQGQGVIKLNVGGSHRNGHVEVSVRFFRTDGDGNELQEPYSGSALTLTEDQAKQLVTALQEHLHNTAEWRNWAPDISDNKLAIEFEGVSFQVPDEDIEDLREVSKAQEWAIDFVLQHKVPEPSIAQLKRLSEVVRNHFGSVR